MGISPPTPILAKEVGRFVREKGRFVGSYEGFRHTLICMIYIDRDYWRDVGQLLKQSTKLPQWNPLYMPSFVKGTVRYVGTENKQSKGISGKNRRWNAQRDSQQQEVPWHIPQPLNKIKITKEDAIRIWHFGFKCIKWLHFSWIACHFHHLLHHFK